ncbi:MAG: bifunctional folylpolyglutamate synthase/dihydrofolate synthase, partial [Acutalibacteraceae bacterium]
MAKGASDYEKALSYTHSLLRFGSRPGLGRMSDLLRLLKNPQDGLRFIHVAGTNGKGSICRMLAAISECEGLKTGLFTSPYVTDFLERIMINGVPAEKEIFSKAALKVKSVIEENNLEINEFEFVTAVAFCIFKEQNCDIVMLETGLGGRFDATNIIKSPVVSVISSISRDHTEVWGDTVEKIAFEKAGIIKPGCTVAA